MVALCIPNPFSQSHRLTFIRVKPRLLLCVLAIYQFSRVANGALFYLQDPADIQANTQIPAPKFRYSTLPLVHLASPNEAAPFHPESPNTVTEMLEQVAIPSIRETLPKYPIVDLKGVSADAHLAIIGDVHGHINELNRLIDQIQRQITGDIHYIFVGDLVAKGPESQAVIQRAMQLGASCVRGNHDQRVLSSRYLLDDDASADTRKAAMPDGLDIKREHEKLAKSLAPEALHYLAQCPLVIKLPPVYRGLVVHAGVNPVHALEHQSPIDLMTMRNIKKNGKAVEGTDKGKAWYKVWDQAVNDQTISADFRGFEKVYYGHAAGRGLKERTHSLGLDSGCVNGDQLTAVILPGHQLVSVDCEAVDLNDE